MSKITLNLFYLFTITFVIIPASPSRAISIVHSRDEFVTVDGSGAEDELEECISTFVGYENTFLRGVSEEYFISYNNTAYDDCVRYCCLEKHFVCSSFSYFKAIRLCYVMNQTKHADHVHLDDVPGWTHYHKVYPEDETTIIPEYYFTSDSATIPVVSTSSIDATEEPVQISVTTTTDDVIKLETTSIIDSVRVAVEVTSSSLENDIITRTMTSSTDNITTLSDVTTEAMISSGGGKYPIDGRAERLLEESRNKACGTNGKECQNGGVCSYVSTAENGVAVSSNILTRCECTEGFTGDFCEQSESEVQSAGLPVFVIVLIVIGILIFLAFAALLTVCCAYKQKTGKYRVKWSRDKWRKKTKKAQTRRSQSFMSDAPFPNRMGEPAYDDALDSPSSLTSV